MKSSPRILLVDDDAAVLTAARRLLTRRGFDVVTAGSGRQALDELAVTRPDVVVSDYTMPQMNGVELLVAIAARMPHARRILLSGHADVGAAVDAILLHKPWDEAELLLHCAAGRLE